MPTIDTKTQLSKEEQDGIIPSVLTRDDLNRLEQENIMQARAWIMRRSMLTSRDIFNQEFIKRLHKKMFDRVWRWAGIYRSSDKNIGVRHDHILTQLQQLLGDANYWLQNKTYNITTLAVVFHHRLVKIHPFFNGNSRHARLLGDVIVAKYNGKKLTWGRGWDKKLAKDPSVDHVVAIRRRYIEALQAADKGRYEDIISFAQS